MVVASHSHQADGLQPLTNGAGSQGARHPPPRPPQREHPHLLRAPLCLLDDQARLVGRELVTVAVIEIEHCALVCEAKGGTDLMIP
jgi:hypothetical protein